ncbi:MAG: 50S ribosomal protein L9 [Phycisphaerae bacterium]|nr:50S ribosomal protein L9 [Phycisphaerae bacterium]
MRLLLRRDIPDLGLCGDIVDVAPGYARNYLLPCRLALEPTKGNLKAIDEDKKKAAEERERRHAFLRSMGKRLTGVEVTISAACTREGHLYGSVGPREISHALMEEGHSVHPDQIKMSQNIKEVGTLEVPVVLADDISATIKVWVAPEKGAGYLEEDEEHEETEVPDVADDRAADQPKPAEADIQGADADTQPRDTGSQDD